LAQASPLFLPSGFSLYLPVYQQICHIVGLFGCLAVNISFFIFVFVFGLESVVVCYLFGR